MSSASPIPVGIHASLGFLCSNCGHEVFAPLEAAGVEGPCPACGRPVRAPGAAPAAAAPGPEFPQPGPQPESTSRGTLADGFVDQNHEDRREGINLLRILLAVLLVLALCTVAVLVLRNHFIR